MRLAIALSIDNVRNVRGGPFGAVVVKEENVIAELSKVIPLVEGEAAVTPPPEDNGKPPEDNGKPPEDNGKPPETNGEPPAEAPKGPKVFDLPDWL